MDPTAFMTKTLTIKIDSPVDTAFAWDGLEWSLTLLVFEPSSSEVLGS